MHVNLVLASLFHLFLYRANVLYKSVFFSLWSEIYPNISNWLTLSQPTNTLREFVHKKSTDSMSLALASRVNGTGSNQNWKISKLVHEKWTNTEILRKCRPTLMLEAIHVNDALRNTITVDSRFTESDLAG